MARFGPVDAQRAVLMVIDIQERLLPAIHDGESMVGRSLVMIEAAKILSLPVLWTEQYVKGLGATDERVRAILEGMGVRPIEKLTFSGCGVEPVKARLADLRPDQVIVAGIEAHVCVQQTVVDLLGTGYEVYVLADAVGSRKPLDYDVGLLRMQQAGAAVTTAEAVIFEMLKEAGTETFKSVLRIIK